MAVSFILTAVGCTAYTATGGLSSEFNITLLTPPSTIRGLTAGQWLADRTEGASVFTNIALFSNPRSYTPTFAPSQPFGQQGTANLCVIGTDFDFDGPVVGNYFGIHQFCHCLGEVSGFNAYVHYHVNVAFFGGTGTGTGTGTSTGTGTGTGTSTGTSTSTSTSTGTGTSAPLFLDADRPFCPGGVIEVPVRVLLAAEGSTCPAFAAADEC